MNIQNNAALALTLVRIGTGLFFLIFGAMKLFGMGPAGFAGMLSSLMPVEGLLALLLAWDVIIIEFVGGAIVLAGGLVPRILYQLTLLGFIAITIVGLVTAHIIPANEDMMQQIIWHVYLLFPIAALLVSLPNSAENK